MIIRNTNGDKLLDVAPDDDGFVTISDLKMPGADLSNLVMQGWCFDGSDLSLADFSRSDLYWARLYDVTAKGANFVDTKLNGANMTHSKFIECNFSNADFSKGNIGSGADFRWTDFTGSNFNSAKLNDVKYNSDTILPIEVNPAERGMKFFIDNK